MRVSPKPPAGPVEARPAPAALKYMSRYLALLESLNRSEVLGRLAIYPAIGVDVLPARYTKVVGLNLFHYEGHQALEQLSAILAPQTLASLRDCLPRNLTTISRIDISRFDVCERTLEDYNSISPKSIIIKGLLDSAFAKEFDIDTERYYSVPPVRAMTNARAWLANMIKWLKVGDTFVVFDRELFSFFSSRSGLMEKKIGLRDQGSEHDFVYIRQVPIIYLPHYARVFQKKGG